MEPKKKLSMMKPATKVNPISKNEEPKIPESEIKTITDLKKLYFETIKLDVELQREIYSMEKVFEERHAAIFDKRAKLIDEYRKRTPNAGDKDMPDFGIKNFWLQVIRVSYPEFISKRDEKILSHLTDVRSKLYNEAVVRFTLSFIFEPNEFFTNRVLTKTYYMNCMPDVEDPLSYDGAEIYRCEGCKIDWKSPEKEKEKTSDDHPMPSFFDFFNPPTLPEDPEDPTYCDVNALLQNDFELGFYFKERVIPKAILFFTGEIADCQTDESESEESDESEDAEDENDEDEENIEQQIENK